jgi:hypothetical protein
MAINMQLGVPLSLVLGACSAALVEAEFATSSGLLDAKSTGAGEHRAKTKTILSTLYPPSKT